LPAYAKVSAGLVFQANKKAPRPRILGRVPGLDHDAVAVDVGVERLIEALRNDSTKGWIVDLVDLFDVKKYN
jgi:hypothetical protein